MSKSQDTLFSVAGRSILVAGGAGGLGEPIVRALAQRGARLTIADIDEGAAGRLARELTSEGAEVITIDLDVRDTSSCRAAVEVAVKHWGRLDGLLNATGVFRTAPALNLDDAAFDLTISVNVGGAFRLAREAGRVMVDQSAGTIVTLASVSSAVANPLYAAYASSKAAVAHLTRVLALEWARDGVRVNAIGPAATPTPLAQPIFEDADRQKAALARIPMGRFGTAEDIVGTTIFLLSPASSFITGQILYVDGGRTVS